MKHWLRLNLNRIVMVLDGKYGFWEMFAPWWLTARGWQKFWLYEWPRLRALIVPVKQYSFNVIDIGVTYDEEKLIDRATNEMATSSRLRNQKKAALSIERFAQRNRGQKMADVEHMEAITGEVKLNREERANADALYKRMSGIK